MKTIGILVFYVNTGNLAAEEVAEWMESLVDDIAPENKDDEDDALNHWERLFVPIKHSDSRIQVIRNDGKIGSDEIVLSELKEKLEKFEEFSLKPYDPNPVIGDPGSIWEPEAMSDLEQDWIDIRNKEELNPYDCDGSQ